MVARFKFYLEYEGTRYSGWQIQKNARTVQGALLEAMHTVFQTAEIELYGAGRTDAGVHALRQVAHLDVRTMLAPEIIRMKVNDELPADINVLEVEKAAPHFHARHDAVARSYLYQISRRRTALGKRYVWWIKDKLDAAAMDRAARPLVGMKDVRSFTSDDPEEKSTKVFIESVTIRETEDLILVRIVGSHFLWNMVRQIVGVLVEIGRGKLPGNAVRELLQTTSREAAQYTAPPSGLFLERVYYRGEQKQSSLEPVLTIAAFR